MRGFYGYPVSWKLLYCRYTQLAGGGLYLSPGIYYTVTDSNSQDVIPRLIIKHVWEDSFPYALKDYSINSFYSFPIYGRYQQFPFFPLLLNVKASLLYRDVNFESPRSLWYKCRESGINDHALIQQFDHDNWCSYCSLVIYISEWNLLTTFVESFTGYNLINEVNLNGFFCFPFDYLL